MKLCKGCRQFKYEEQEPYYFEDEDYCEHCLRFIKAVEEYEQTKSDS